jgi:hypothetical protein
MASAEHGRDKLGGERLAGRRRVPGVLRPVPGFFDSLDDPIGLRLEPRWELDGSQT